MVKGPIQWFSNLGAMTSQPESPGCAHLRGGERGRQQHNCQDPVTVERFKVRVCTQSVDQPAMGAGSPAPNSRGPPTLQREWKLLTPGLWYQNWKWVPITSWSQVNEAQFVFWWFWLFIKICKTLLWVHHKYFNGQLFHQLYYQYRMLGRIYSKEYFVPSLLNWSCIAHWDYSEQLTLRQHRLPESGKYFWLKLS